MIVYGYQKHYSNIEKFIVTLNLHNQIKEDSTIKQKNSIIFNANELSQDQKVNIQNWDRN